MNTTPAGDDELRHGYYIGADGARRPIPVFIINRPDCSLAAIRPLERPRIEIRGGVWVDQGGAIAVSR